MASRVWERDKGCYVVVGHCDIERGRSGSGFKTGIVRITAASNSRIVAGFSF